jgi:hypothetical protein
LTASNPRPEELNQRRPTYSDLVICAPTFLHASRTTISAGIELRALVSSVACRAGSSVTLKRVLKKLLRSGVYAVLACALLLLCVDAASASAWPQTNASNVRSGALPEEALIPTPATEGSGSVAGTVLDASGASVAGAEVTLMPRDGTQSHAMVSASNGEFVFVNILPGSYLLIVNAADFALFTTGEFVIAAQQAYEVPDISLSLATNNTEVTVRPSDVIAAEQIRTEERQRLVGVLPNFYTSYISDAAPLTWQQKFSFATRGTFDPVAMLGVGVAAGVEQATNAFPGYGQGAAGYGKRFAAKFADGRSSDYLTHAIFPSLLHQDPRYFYQGTGSMKSRLLHAIDSAFLTHGDNGRTEPNYSYVLGDMCSGALSNLYYPRANRGVHLVFSNAAVGLAGRVGGNILREFLPKHSTTNVLGE